VLFINKLISESFLSIPFQLLKKLENLWDKTQKNYCLPKQALIQSDFSSENDLCWLLPLWFRFNIKIEITVMKSYWIYRKTKTFLMFHMIRCTCLHRLCFKKLPAHWYLYSKNYSLYWNLSNIYNRHYLKYSKFLARIHSLLIIWLHSEFTLNLLEPGSIVNLLSFLNYWVLLLISG
jgi:hypothetical protein